MCIYRLGGSASNFGTSSGGPHTSHLENGLLETILLLWAGYLPKTSPAKQSQIQAQPSQATQSQAKPSQGHPKLKRKPSPV